MPASRSRSRTPEPAPAPARGRLWPLLLIIVLVILVVVAAVLPASLATRFLPPQVRAEDLSGSLWHGSAGRITYAGRDVGALEWHLHPAALLSLTLGLELHWVKVSCVVDGSAELRRSGFVAHDIKGSGAIQDLRDLGVAPGWRGNATLALSELRGDYAKISAALGSLDVAQVSATGIAHGADLGSYQASLGPQSIGADGSLEAALHDTGGPLALQATLKYAPGTGTGLLSGTLQERSDASQALRDEIAGLAQLRPRDAQGRIPVDVEFAL